MDFDIAPVYIMRTLSIEDKVLLSCVRLTPTQKEIEELNNLIPQLKDWDYFCSNIIKLGYGPIFFKKTASLSNNILIPEFVQRKLKKSYLKTLSMNIRLADAFSKIVERCNAEGIQVVALKGIYLTEWLYGDIGLRQCSDIDLLVREADGKRCLELLDELGYKTESNEFLWVKAEIIHYPARILDEEYDLNVNELFNRIQPIKIHNTPAYALDFYDMLIHVCIHMDKHFRKDHIQFNSFADLTNILIIYQNKIDWNILKDRCIQFKCETIFFKNLILVQKYFNAPLPPEIISKYTSALDNVHEERFLQFLKGERIPRTGKTGIQHHIGMIKGFASISDSLLYFYRIIFPSKAFMIEKYNPQPLKGSMNPLLGVRGIWWLWYPYRWWVGVKGLIKLLRS